MRSILLRLAPLGLILAGCSSSAPTADDRAVGDLNALLGAYHAATEAMGRPPQQRADLVTHLPEGTDLDDLLSRFVIIWGTDPQASTSTTSDPPLILGYARKSHGGMRLVATVLGVFEMEEQQFQSGNFPAGHLP